MWGPRYSPYGDERLPATVILPDLLWLGGTADATDEQGLKSHGIKARLNVRTTKLRELEGIQTHWHPLVDWWGNKPELFENAVSKLKYLMDNKIPTLLHCHMGVSRSTSVLATWWARDQGITFDESVDVIRKMRPFVRPFIGVRDVARFHLGEIGAHAICTHCTEDIYFDAPHSYVGFDFVCKNCGHLNTVNAFEPDTEAEPDDTTG